MVCAKVCGKEQLGSSTKSSIPAVFACSLHEELTAVKDEMSDLEDELAALKARASALGRKYMQAKKESEKADREVQVRLGFSILYLFRRCPDR